jgi:aspartyl-tRNA(Asn)/glutamyl-tRNA(Gln) amidotransferase subunit C
VAISEQDVRHIAKLASLALSDQDVQRMASELGVIVGYIEQLKEVDTAGVEAIANVAGLSNVTRSDVPGAMLTPKQALANAALVNEVAILVPKAVER